MRNLLGVLVTCSILLVIVSAEEEPLELFNLSIIHINDFHAKFQPVSVSTSPCRSQKNDEGRCFGGIARVVTAMRDLQQSMPNAVLLNAGDSFQGSLFYSLFKWNITMEFMNRIPFDATALGNHEFDDGVDGVVPYIEGLNNPVVAANMDASDEPELQGKFKPSVVIEREGRKIGIIGCITKYTKEMATPGKLRFVDEKEPVAAEAARLREEGVDILVLLSHSGYNVDQKLAEEIPDLDIIVGAHTHSFLYTGTPPSIEVASGEYPTVVTQASGRRVLVVQAYAYTKYVGALSVQFNAQGEVVSWSGNPVLLDSSVEEDPVVKSDLQPWEDEANVIGDKTIGTSAVLLDHSSCYRGECNLGNFVTDAMVAEHVDMELEGAWTAAAIAIINPGGLRSSIGESPNITYNDLVTSNPFQNTIDVIELQGKDLLQVLELSASKQPRSYRDFTKGKGCMQVSGIQAVYNMRKPAGSRLLDAQVRCAKCRVPTYHPVDLEEWYAVAMPSYLSNGGSGYNLIAERGRNKVIGITDVDVFSKYLLRESPVLQGLESRITVVS